MKHTQIGTVLTKKWLTPQVFELVITIPEPHLSIKPGQFVEMSCHGQYPVFLNRPFSPYLVDKQEWHFMIQVKGKGTLNLSRMNPGESITLLAPLGKPFPVPSSKAKLLLVAGGVGLAPIYFYLSTYLPSHPKLFTTLLYGTTSLKDKISLPLFEKVNHFYYHADESDNQLCQNLFEYYSSLSFPDFDQAILCGPIQMMKSFSTQFERENKNHLVSLEIMMACGLGLCKGCSISTSIGMKSVCSDGPVFDGSILDWNLL